MKKKNIYSENIRISLVMAVYNGEKFLKQTIESVLRQTYQNFEFLIINDCSTDSSLDIMKSFFDPRIQIIENEQNLKLAASLNIGIKRASGKYILRLDGDDVCLPYRFEKQVSYMEAHPEISVAFGNIIKFTGNQLLQEYNTNSYAPDYIRSVLLFYNVIHHPCVIMRKELFDVFAYRPEYSVTEDLALWLDISSRHSIGYIAQPLLLYRVHPGQVTTLFHERQRSQEMQMKRPVLEHLTGPLTEAQLLFHSRVSAKQEPVKPPELLSWLHFLLQCNHAKRCYPQKAFRQIVIRMFFTVGIYNHYGIGTLGKGLLSFGILPVLQFFTGMVYNGIKHFLLFEMGKIPARNYIGRYL